MISTTNMIDPIAPEVPPSPGRRDSGVTPASPAYAGVTGVSESLEAPAFAGATGWNVSGEPAAETDPWVRRARPTFLYVMYALLLWSIPMGLIAAFRPALAEAIAKGMTAYLNGLPEPLYALFGTGYLGYTVAREWGKAKTR